MREAKKKDGYSPSKVLYSTISDDISVDDGREGGGVRSYHMQRPCIGQSITAY